MSGGIQLEPWPAPAQQPHPGSLPPAPRSGAESGPGRARRGFLRAVFGLGVVAGTAAALAPVLRAGRPKTGGPAPGTAEAASGGFDEMYRGRHIRIGGGSTGATAASVSSHSRLSPEPASGIQIDGRPLPVMRRADGSYLSSVNHYESFPSLLEAARAAVDDLGGGRLSLSGPVHHV